MTEMDKKTAIDMKANGEAHAQPSQLEELFSEAEEKGFNDYKYKPTEKSDEPASIEPPAESEPIQTADCDHADSTPAEREWCTQCQKLTCPSCRSSLDPTYCDRCFHVDEKPLIDQEGVTHQGRELIPGGPVFSTTTKRILEMEMADLEDHIKKYKLVIKQAEIGLEYKRVTLGMMQMHLNDKKDSVRRRLRAEKTPGTTTKKVSVSRTPKQPAVSFQQQMAAIAQIMAKRKGTTATADPAAASKVSLADIAKMMNPNKGK